MVIGPNFVYIHIPRTAGDAIHDCFRALDDPRLQIDLPHRPRKHHSPRKRKEAQGKRDYVVSIRRLPNWMLSWLYSVSGRPSLAKFWGWSDPTKVWRPESALRGPIADRMLNRFTAGCKPTHWIRGEWLFYDFVRAVGSILYPLTDQQMRTIAQVRAKSPRQYNHDVHSFWSPQQIQELYELNPRWSRIERLIYTR